MKEKIHIYHDLKTLETKRKIEFKRKKSFSYLSKKYLKKLDERRFFNYGLYGKVLSITTLTIKRSLFVLENIIPMTFFLLSILGEIFYKKFGFKELLRITLNDKPRKF